MAKTNTLSNSLLNLVLRSASYTAPTTIYVALFTAAPGPTGGGTEVSGTAYARVAATFSAAASGATSNSADVTFATAGGSWGTVTHFALFDALTNGNMLFYGAMDVAKTVGTGDVVKILATTLTLAEV
jgi:hypothetical protein